MRQRKETVRLHEVERVREVAVALTGLCRDKQHEWNLATQLVTKRASVISRWAFVIQNTKAGPHLAMHVLNSVGLGTGSPVWTYRSYSMDDDVPSAEVFPCPECNGSGGAWVSEDEYACCTHCEGEGGHIECAVCCEVIGHAPMHAQIVVDEPVCKQCVLEALR